MVMHALAPVAKALSTGISSAGKYVSDLDPGKLLGGLWSGIASVKTAVQEITKAVDIEAGLNFVSGMLSFGKQS